MNKKVLTLCVSALLAGTISSVDAFAQKYSMFTQPGTTANSFLKQGTAFQLADNDGRVLAIERTGSAYNYHYELKMVSVDASAELAETLWKVTYQENKEGGSSFTFTSAAYGIPLSFTERDVRLSGAAIECRINARTSGTIKRMHIPGGPFVRFDTYLEPGTEVPAYYDPLVGKLIVYTKTREESIRKMRAYLCELLIEGIETNIGDELRIISDPAFISGEYTTTFMEGR